jgi:hypothetical protein
LAFLLGPDLRGEKVRAQSHAMARGAMAKTTAATAKSARNE